MARIFVSHSSTNNAEALALRDWLLSQGWNDLFLDIDPTKGLVAAERWQAALRNSLGRCKAVIFCLSPEWRDSQHCISEFNEAMHVRAAPVGVIVKSLAIERVPAEMTSVWQLVDLTRGGAPLSFTVAPPPERNSVRVTFPEEELRRLRAGLAKLGLVGFETASFPWPPPNEPARVPYRGLAPLDTADAGVFFGRDSDLIRAREELLTLRQRGGGHLFVILGGSGAGKSSFLRAGLIPRIAREDRDFLVLPVVRPSKAPLTGSVGLAVSLADACETLKMPCSPGSLKQALETESQALSRTLAGLQRRAASSLLGEGQAQIDRLPTVVLAIDQAEELLHTDTEPEARGFFSHLADTLKHGPDAIAILTIRSDRYEVLQRVAREFGLPPIQPFDLAPVTPYAFRDAITGPAERADPPIRVATQLADRLIADMAAQGADPLPLLAFTLERLYLDFGRTERRLTLGHYHALDGLKGSIEAALRHAFEFPDRSPVIPQQPELRDRLLEDVFVPALVDINETNNEPLRRIALEAELPETGRGLVTRLVEARLLVRGIRRGAQQTPTIEVAHEALLRQWDKLRTLLERRSIELKTLKSVERAAQLWEQNGRTADWLDHKGNRLSEALRLGARPEFARRLAGLPQEYVSACQRNVDPLNARIVRLLLLAHPWPFVVGLLVGLAALSAPAQPVYLRMLDDRTIFQIVGGVSSTTLVLLLSHLLFINVRSLNVTALVPELSHSRVGRALSRALNSYPYLGALFPSLGILGGFLFAVSSHDNAPQSLTMDLFPDFQPAGFEHAQLLSLVIACAISSVAWLGLSLIPKVRGLLSRLSVGFAAAVSALFVLLLFASPPSIITFATLIGTLSMLMVASIGAVCMLMGANYLGRRSGAPVLGALFVGAVLFGSLGLNDRHHPITPRPDRPDVAPNVMGVHDAALRWLAARHDLQQYVGNGYPVFIIAIQGGGFEAAAAAALFLSELQDECPNFADHVFAISAVSGSAIGASIFGGLVSKPTPASSDIFCNRTAGQLASSAESSIVGDHLSAVAPFVLLDAIAAFFPLPIASRFDRARALERSVVSNLDKATLLSTRDLASAAALLDADYYRHWDPLGSVPALILNTTWAETGRGMPFAPFALKGAATTSDMLEELRPRISLIEAAVASARFPVLLPGLTLTFPNQAFAPRQSMTLIDGGAADDSGITTALQMYRTLLDAFKRFGLVSANLKLIILTNALDQSRDDWGGSSGYNPLLYPLTANARNRDQLAKSAVAAAVAELRGGDDDRNSTWSRPNAIPSILLVNLSHLQPRYFGLSRGDMDLLKILLGRSDLCPVPDRNPRNPAVPGIENVVRQNSCVKKQIVQLLAGHSQ